MTIATDHQKANMKFSTIIIAFGPPVAAVGAALLLHPDFLSQMGWLQVLVIGAGVGIFGGRVARVVQPK